MTGCIFNHSSDPLGRWTIVHLNGTLRKISIVTIYQLPATSRTGPCNVFSQQKQLLPLGSDPCKQFHVDLNTTLFKLNAAGYSLILGGDFNKDLHKSPGFQGTFSTLGLVDCHGTYHSEEALPSFLQGRTQIDYVYVSQALYPTITGCGILAANWKFLLDC